MFKNEAPPRFLCPKSCIFGFFDFEPTKYFLVPTGVCMGRSGTSAHALYALFSHFCCVGGFGDLGDPVVPTLGV